ncbi:MAG: hypothetical protein IT260_19395 [Saprospiraceae bacterium]|nr:hypothetical protein [Saprospiraceae bacterium]
MKQFPTLSLSLFVLALLALGAHSTQAQVSGTKPEFILYKHNSGPGGALPVLTGDLLGEIKFTALTAQKSVRSGAVIRSIATGPVSPDYLPANLIFQTGAPAVHDRMTITSTGLVGIGTIDPLYHLDIVGNTHTSGDFFGRIHMDASLGTPASAPNTYLSEAYFEYKTAADMGVTDNTSNGGLLTLAPSFNSAGQTDHQLFFNAGGIYHRNGDAGSGAWSGAWQRLMTSADISGTTNRVAKFNSPNSVGDSRLFDNGARVGINNFAPAFDLDITGTTNVNGSLFVSSRLGIGNTSPTAALDVTGNARVSGETHLAQRVNIGTTDFATGFLLNVGGGIIAEEVRVQLETDWPDYVFEPNYALPNTAELEQFIQTNKHLPGVPSAAEVSEKGLDLGEMNRILMEKVEELTLLLIQQQKQIDALNTAVQAGKH